MKLRVKGIIQWSFLILSFFFCLFAKADPINETDQLEPWTFGLGIPTDSLPVGVPIPPRPIFWTSRLSTTRGVLITTEKTWVKFWNRFQINYGGSLHSWGVQGDQVYGVSSFLSLRFTLLSLKEFKGFIYWSPAGPTVFNKQTLGPNRFGSFFMFQDLIGFGFRVFKDHPVEIRGSLGHYSNGGLFLPNPGIQVPFFFSIASSF